MSKISKSLVLSALLVVLGSQANAQTSPAPSPTSKPQASPSKPATGGGNATVYKCQRGGRIEYTNTPCAADAKPAQLKGSVTSLPKSAFVGQEQAKGGAPSSERRTIFGITPPDPIADCKKKGGEYDREFRACKLP